MAIIKEWETDPYSLAAIWKIEENESFFQRGTELDFPEISFPKRRLERLAGRFLLKYLKADFPLWNISPDAEDKPRIHENQYFFSISHSWPYVAVILSPYRESGIDIQCWHPRIDRIQHKFLSPAEQKLIGAEPRKLTLAWSAKEAAYKWQGRRGLQFIPDIQIKGFTESKGLHKINTYVTSGQSQSNIQIEGLLDTDYSLAYVIHP